MSKLKLRLVILARTVLPRSENVSILMKVVISMWRQLVLSLNDVNAENSMKSMPRVMASRYLLLLKNQERVPAEYLPRISGVFENCESRREFYGRS